MMVKKMNKNNRTISSIYHTPTSWHIGSHVIDPSPDTALQFPNMGDTEDIPFPPPEKPRFTFIDLFAGIGGFRLGLQEAGGACLFSSEWNQPAAEVYAQNFGEYPYGDITQEATKAEIPFDFDILSAGFPCQPFSISGRMRGFEDTRGTLIYEVLSIMERNRPRIVILENVKHLVYHDRGRTLETILLHMERLGYKVSWHILNATSFGVPQNRERIIIIATVDQLFSFETLSELRPSSKLGLADFLDAEGDFEFMRDPYTLLDVTKRQKSGLIFAGYRNKRTRENGTRPGTEHLSRVHKQPNRIYSSEGVHPALPSQEVSGRFFILHRGVVRKLTIQECYRIMGFPERFIRHKSLAEQYKQIGNSVCVPMVKKIAEELIHQSFI